MSFEPNIEAYSKFSKTLKKNLNLSKKIKLENFGLSDKSAKLKMQSMLKFGYAQTGGSSVVDKNLNDKNFKRYFVASKKNGKIIHNYSLEEKTNRITMKLKNSIMQLWANVKLERGNIDLSKILWIMKARVKGKRCDNRV